MVKCRVHEWIEIKPDLIYYIICPQLVFNRATRQEVEYEDRCCSAEMSEAGLVGVVRRGSRLRSADDMY